MGLREGIPWPDVTAFNNDPSGHPRKRLAEGGGSWEREQGERGGGRRRKKLVWGVGV